MSSGLTISAGIIRFGNSTDQFTSADASVSSSTVLPGQTFTATSFDACLAGSTVAVVASTAAYPHIAFSGAISVSTSAFVGLAILMDGNALGDYGGAGINWTEFRDVRDVGFTLIPTRQIPTGSHSFCLQARVSDGTATLENDGESIPIFSVLQLK